ncbi:hypothetical protein STEG23_007668, partial [Scotinomys teguina]
PGDQTRLVRLGDKGFTCPGLICKLLFSRGLLMVLPPPLEFWDCRWASPCLADE